MYLSQNIAFWAKIRSIPQSKKLRSEWTDFDQIINKKFMIKEKIDLIGQNEPIKIKID